MRELPLLLLLLTAACGGGDPQNAAEIANVAENQAESTSADAPVLGNAQVAAPEPRVMNVGPLRIPYDASLLTPVPARIALPPDWKVEVDGVKLVASDRAELIGKAECMYGQGGTASRCNVSQEAGLAFAALDVPFAEVGARLPADQRQSISLAGAEGLSWLIGAEGKGAEYILLPAGEGSLLIARQFRATGNPDETAVGTVLSDMKLDRGE